MMKRRKYTTEQLDFLRTGYMSMNVRDLTRAFNSHFKSNKTEGQIKAALKNHKIRCGRAHKDRLIDRNRLFSPDQVEFLIKNYSGRSIAEMTELFNNHFGTRRTRQQIKTAVHNRGITSGRTGHFPKNHKPWNHGTKGQGLTGANRGSFQKGNLPPNRKPLGSERICSKDGYVYIKVAGWDHNFNRPTRWKQKHIHIWEQKNGPVPDGFCLKFIDGDKTHIDTSNLRLISRVLNLRLNKHGYNDAPDEIKPSILALARMETKMFKKMKGAG